MPEKETFDVKLLVPLTYREVEADHTFTDVIPTIRFLVYNSRPIKVEMLLDLVNKYQRDKSKPFAYFWMSTPEQLQKLGNTALALSTLLAFYQSGNTNPSLSQIESAVKTLLDMSKPSITNALEMVFRDLLNHSLALSKARARVEAK